MDALRARPDAILVSAETAKDYSIVPGDRIRIRVPDANGNLKTVEFTMAGIALEFPTAPKDAFLVANLVVCRRPDGQRPDLVRPGPRRRRRRVGIDRASPAGSATAGRSPTSGRPRPGSPTASPRSTCRPSSLLDVVFAVVIAAVGVALFLLAGLAERRRELATLIAIGAEPRQVRSSMLGETLFVGVAGHRDGAADRQPRRGRAAADPRRGLRPAGRCPGDPAGRSSRRWPASSVLALVAALSVADRGLSRLSVVAALRER